MSGSKKSNTRKHRLLSYAQNLRDNLPHSEKWFFSLYKRYEWPGDTSNGCFAGRIPDIINKKFKYIIEIDGSIHDRKDIQELDKIKTKKFESLGYIVIRVKSYSLESFRFAMRKLSQHRAQLLNKMSQRELSQLRTQIESKTRRLK